jgi:aconitate decarboxylase
MTAALLNGTFIQGFELDDWHSEAPLHSNSLILPALFASLSLLPTPVSGKDFLLAYIVGLEIGPRIGNALYGKHILSMGWHSGAVFGPSASCAAVCKLLSLNAARVEDALGIACTQACGLMSAQYESEVKRMQHGFGARNGLLGAMLAKGGYVGIKRVYEREYGGFLKQFSSGNGKEPPYLVDEICMRLGEEWKTINVKVKPYASMAATHAGVDCVSKAQEAYPDLFASENLVNIESIELSMGAVSFHHGGFEVQRPLTCTGAQMSCKYIACTQLVDRQVLPPQFKADMLDRDVIWVLLEKTKCTLEERLLWGQELKVVFKGGQSIKVETDKARGVDPGLSDEEVVEKWRGLMNAVIGDERRDMIEREVLNLDVSMDVGVLGKMLESRTLNPIE